MSQSAPLLVVGGGSFGTAIAMLLARAGNRVTIWTRRPELADEINAEHTNEAYAPSIKLPAKLRATPHLDVAVREASAVVMAVPAVHFRSMARAVGEHIRGDQLLVHTCKGLDPRTGRRMAEVLHDETCARKIGALGGPSLASEMIAGLPGALVVASRFQEVCELFREALADSSMQTITSHDVVGVELGGALTNVVALAVGIGEGKGLGASARALLMTRGLEEMRAYAAWAGAEPETPFGLAGVGDLMASCGCSSSPDRVVGEHLARGLPLEKALRAAPSVCEGVVTAPALAKRAARAGLQMSVLEGVAEELSAAQSKRN